MTTALKPIPQHTERGIPLLRIIWEQIKADPSAWNQGSWYWVDYDVDASVIAYLRQNKVLPWDCGTACCIAGHVAFATGATIPASIRDDLGSKRASGVCEYVVPPDGGPNQHVEDYARVTLGLIEEQAACLFAASRTAEEIEAMVTALEADPYADLFDFED